MEVPRTRLLLPPNLISLPDRLQQRSRSGCSLSIIIVEALGTLPSNSQHGFEQTHSTTTALLPISARAVSGFKQHKPSSRTIAIVVDISKAFDTVSHRFLIETIQRYRLRNNLVRWLVATYVARILCFYQQHHSPSHQVRAGVPQRSVLSPALFNNLVSDCPITDTDMT